MTLLADTIPFQITDVIPDNGGDGRYVTTTILGAQFDPERDRQTDSTWLR